MTDKNFTAFASYPQTHRIDAMSFATANECMSWLMSKHPTAHRFVRERHTSDGADHRHGELNFGKMIAEFNVGDGWARY